MNISAQDLAQVTYCSRKKTWKVLHLYLGEYNPPSIPAGYEYVAFRPPNIGDLYLWDKVVLEVWPHDPSHRIEPRIILKKIDPPTLKLCATGEEALKQALSNRLRNGTPAVRTQSEVSRRFSLDALARTITAREIKYLLQRAGYRATKLEVADEPRSSYGLGTSGY